MIKLFYDFHIHTCLSPCGDDEMIPENILGMAFTKGLNLIAITDHNSLKNCRPVIEHASEYGIIAIPGVELNTSEEIHVLMLFRTIEEAEIFDSFLERRLVKVFNNEKIFGKQEVVNMKGDTLYIEESLLINVTDISFDEIVKIADRFNAIIIPAHIDKDSNSVLSILGQIPENIGISLVEIKDKSKTDSLLESHPYLNKCKLLFNSDAHYLTDINEPFHYIEVTESTINCIFSTLLEKKELL